MNARQRRRRARRPYAAVPATQQRVDAEYRLLMNAQHELLVAAADERIAQFDPALYELLGEAWEPLQGPDDETPKTRRRRPRRAVKPAPAPEPEPEEVDGVFLASGHQITIQKAAAAEVMKGFRRVELLARGRAAAAEESGAPRAARRPSTALPSLAAAAPPAPMTPRGQRRRSGPDDPGDARRRDFCHDRSLPLGRRRPHGAHGARGAPVGDRTAATPADHPTCTMPEQAPAAAPDIHVHVAAAEPPVVNVTRPDVEARARNGCGSSSTSAATSQLRDRAARRLAALVLTDRARSRQRR